jgi:hypothetical protein
VLCDTHAGALQVSAEERERAKRVVYGIVYGQTPFGLAQSLADQGISTKAAEGLIDSFLARFPGQWLGDYGVMLLGNAGLLSAVFEWLSLKHGMVLRPAWYSWHRV